MALIPLYRDLQKSLAAMPPGPRAWPWLESTVYRPHHRFFSGLQETYGTEMFGPAGVPGALLTSAPMLRQALTLSHTYGLEQSAARLLDTVSPLLPGDTPDLWLATLLFMAPAGTISVDGKPAIVLGMERFHPAPPAGGDKLLYHPREIEEMIPHEAAHAARMQALRLPPTPRRLTLLEMVMLEGTALTFTDRLVGRTTLATFMPQRMLDWHRQHDAAAIATAAADFASTGMPAFHRYFGSATGVNGYYVGYSLCRQYLDRFGDDAVTELISLPSAEILRRLGRSDLLKDAGQP